MEKAEALENRYNESQNHAKRLMREIDSLKKQKTQCERVIKGMKHENNSLKGKLDDLWSR